MQSKLPKVGTTIFTTMSKMAQEYQAINLSQGFPNFPIDPVLQELLQKNNRENVHQYAPMAGLPVLLEAVANTIHSSYGRTINPATELLITAGATQGIYTAIQALVGIGEEVVIIDPAYDCYEPAIILAGGKAVHVAMTNDFTIDWFALRNVISQKTKLLIVNNPHNPSGRIMTLADSSALTQLMQDYPNLLLLSDEVYEYITFEQEHLSANRIDAIHDRTIIVSSFGKTFHITGWKVGYLVAPEKLMNEIKKVHQFLVFSVNSVAQKTLADYLASAAVAELGSFYLEKRNRFQQQLLASKFELLPSEGTYFQLADYSKISNLNDVSFCEWLTKEVGVAAIPLSVFYHEPAPQSIIRFCYAKTDETLQSASERLCAI
uniref:methionine aminotransferase n=1 Tax=Fluviicola sp. TaxID=1917219 RepID=UPI00404A12C7